MLNDSLLPSFLDCKFKRVVFTQCTANDLHFVLNDQLLPHIAATLTHTASVSCEVYTLCLLILRHKWFWLSALLTGLLVWIIGYSLLSFHKSHHETFSPLPREISAYETLLKNSFEWVVYQRASASALFIASQHWLRTSTSLQLPAASFSKLNKIVSAH